MRIWLVAAILLLAGCSDKPSPAQADDDFQDVEPGDDTGAISGVVVDAAIVPIAGAVVRLVGGGEPVAADNLGRFVFSDLAPGTYFLEASADDYLPVQTGVTVEAGAVAKPRVLLAFDPAPRPYHQTQQFNGHMEVYGTVASFVLHLALVAVGSSICDCEWSLEFDEIPAEVLVEGAWVDSVPDPQGPQHDYLEVFDVDFDDCLETGSHPSGFRHSITAACDFDREDYRIALTGPQTWMAIQQDYELFVTTFYRDAAPESWSFLAGDR